MAADFTDTGVLTEAGWGGGEAHLSPRARKKARDRKMKRQEKWRKAQEARANWTLEMFEEERARLAKEVAAMLEREHRHAA